MSIRQSPLLLIALDCGECSALEQLQNRWSGRLGLQVGLLPEGNQTPLTAGSLRHHGVAIDERGKA